MSENNITQNKKDWYQLSVKQVFKALKTNDTGLNFNDAKTRLKEYGRNELKVKKQGPLIRFLLQFHNSLLYILMVAAVVCYFLGEYIDMGVIIAVVLATAIIGFIQEGKAEASLEALKKMMVPKCTVFRDGKKEIILARDLVPGDIVLLEAGNRVPADLRLFSEKNLSTDEAMLTGESLPVIKNTEPVLRSNLSIGEQRCLCFSGTFVVRGRGQGVVIETGEQTEIGRIAGLMKKTKKVIPPIMKKINDFTRFIIIIIILFSAITFAIGIWFGQAWDFMFLATVGMIVAMIPEGLPAVLITAFAIGAMAMVRQNVLIRRLPATETLGCTTVICSDKTGTLTKNEMTVVKIYCGGKDYQLSGVGYEPKGEFMQDNKQINLQDHKVLAETLNAGCLCNHAILTKKEGKHIILGDPTEGALVVSAVKGGVAKKVIKLDEIPFDSKEQYMATLQQCERKDKNIIYVKGSPERILKMCDKQLNEEGVEILKKEQALEKASEMAKDALRVLGMAYKLVDKTKKSIARASAKREEEDLSSSPARASASGEEDMKNLIFLGFQGMIDPPRKEAIEAIKKCKTAGIRSVMITGDHAQTAKAIANQLGIGDGQNKTLTGEEMSKMNDKEFFEVVEKVSVYARVSPEHKFKVVKTLQERGHVVAVTGDGVNDAPALKKADIGIAMGITGTEVSKEASDMILIDNNFASIVKAVEKGRHIFNNIWKVFLFLLPTNGAEGLSIVGAILMMPFVAVFADRLPIEPVQILWSNLITAIACAVPLIWEPKEKDILKKPPRDPNEKLYNSLFLQKIGIVSVVSFIAIIGMFLVFYYTANGGSENCLSQAQTIAFTTLIMIQIFYLFTARSIEKSAFTFSPFSNKLLLLGAGITVGLQLIIIYSYPLFGFSPFKTVPFPIEWWIPIILVSSLGFFAIELEKFLRKKFAS